MDDWGDLGDGEWDGDLWIARDGRRVLISEMPDAWLANTIHFLEARGAKACHARLIAHVHAPLDRVTKAEAEMTDLPAHLMRKYLHMLKERDSRARMPSTECC